MIGAGVALWLTRALRRAFAEDATPTAILTPIAKLGVAANGVKPPLGQSFLGGSGSCMLGTHTDVANFMGASTWCMSAWVREE